MSSGIIQGVSASRNNRKNRYRSLRKVAAMTVAAIAVPQVGWAGTYINSTSGGLWGTSANWTGGVPNASSAIADFSTLTLSANNTVHLDGSYTVGALKFGDVSNLYNWTLDNNGNSGNTLTLAGASTPTINVSSTQSASIGATIAGNQGFTLSGGGVLTLTGNNSYTGVTNVNGGTLVLNTAVVSTGLTGIAANPVLMFDPTQSSSITTSGTQVTGLTNLAGSNYSATAGVGSVTLGTINGHTALSLNGASGLASAFPATTTPETIFAVINPSSVTNNGAIVAASDVGGLELRLSGGKLTMLRQGQLGFTPSTTSLTAGTPTVVAFTYNSTAGAYYAGGAFAGNTSSPSLTGSTSLRIGYQFSYGSNQDFFSGTIGTILAYNTSLSALAISNTSNALLSEYAAPVTLSLPVINLSSSSSNLAIAGTTQAISSLTGVAGSNVYLGGNPLTVGDSTSTVFAGNISDTGTGTSGTGGVLTKVGSGTLNVSGGISSTVGVKVNAGTLLVSGAYSTSGNTSVSAGTLSITGTDSDTGSHTVTGGTLSISGPNSATGPFVVSNGGVLSLAGSSSASGAITITSGGTGTINLVANAGNTTGTAPNLSSSAIGSPASLAYADNLGTTNIQLRGDSSVTFANSGPTGGTGGYPNQTTINYDVNNAGGGSTATNQTLSLGSTTGGAAGYGTYNTNINVTGGNGYTMAIPAITNANGAFLKLNASTANLSIPGGIANIGPLSVAGASNTSIGTITGSGALTKTGAGTLLLTSSNTYTGSTNISGGTLALASGATLSTSSISLGTGATFDLSSNPSFALPTSGTILSGTGTIVGPYNHSVGVLSPGSGPAVGTLNVSSGLTLSGGSLSFVISGSNNSTGGIYNDLLNVNGPLNLIGATTISLGAVSPTLPSGTVWTLINFTGGSPTGTGSLNTSTSAFSIIQVPNAIELKYNSGIVGGDVWTGSANSNWDSSTLNWVPAGSTAPISYTNGDNVTFNDSSSVVTTTVNLTAALSPSSVLVNSNANSYTFGGTGSITGLTGLVKQGTSTLTINTSNSYSGTTNISGGTVINAVATGSGLGTGPLFIGTGATLIIGNGSGGGNPVDGSKAVLNSSIDNEGTIVYNGSDFNYLPVAVIGAGGINVSSGTLGIGSVNNYTGPVNVIGTGSTIRAYEVTSLGTGLVTIDNGGIVQVGYANGNTSAGAIYTNGFNISGIAITTTGGTGPTTFSGPANLFDQDTNIILASPLTLTNNVTSTNNQSLSVNGGTLTFGGNVSLGTGNLQSGGSLVFAPPAATTITITVGSVNNFISPASVTQNGAGTTILNGSNTYTGGTTVTSGTLVFNTPGALPNFSALTISANASAVVSNYSTGTKNTLFTSSLALDPAGKLNLGNNDLVVQNGNLSSISLAVASGYNSGSWNSSAGILSSAAASDPKHLHALGVIQNSVDQTTTGSTLYGGSLPAFDGATASAATDVLIKYTYYGDANLDGRIDGSDYSLIDSSFISEKTTSTSVSGWYNGDFNYDGVVNGSDYTLLDNAYNTQGAQIALQIASPTAQIGGGANVGATSGSTSAVPEPAALGLLGLGAMGLLGRKSRRTI